MTPVIRAPDWESRPTAPAGGGDSAKLALSRADGRSTPRQLGPMRRMPPRRAAATISSCSRRPSSPISEKPAEMMIAWPTPAAAASGIRAGMKRGGMATTMRSTGRPMAARLSYTGSPRIVPPLGLTA